MVNKEKYPDRKVLKKEAEKTFDEKNRRDIEIPAEYGTEPTLECTPSDDSEKKLLDALKSVLKSNKIKYQNKKIV